MPNPQFLQAITCSVTADVSVAHTMPTLSFFFNHLHPSNAPFHR
jgi:hypothetical protein